MYECITFEQYPETNMVPEESAITQAVLVRPADAVQAEKQER